MVCFVKQDNVDELQEGTDNLPSFIQQIPEIYSKTECKKIKPSMWNLSSTNY